MNDFLKLPPNSIEAEQNVLGALMQDSKRSIEALEILREEDFYKSEHKHIFKAIGLLSKQNKEIDAITVSELLESKNMLEHSGGLPYLVEMVNSTFGSGNIVAYADIIKERATLRSIITAVNSIADKAYYPDGMNADSIIEFAYDSMRMIDIKTESDIPTINDSILSAIAQLEYRHNHAGELTGVPTGFKALDDMTLGLQKGELYVLGGRPAMGKSTLALNMSIHAATKKKHVLFFSLEMPKERMIDKCVSHLGSVPFENIKTGSMTESDWDMATHAMTLIKESGLRIDDRGGQSLSSIVMKCKKLNTKRKLDLIVIDYMQLIRVEGASRYDEVSQVSMQLKALAKNLDCPVLALSQLSRNLESRQDKRPKLSDLRESGQIEQDADVIMFVYRDEIYYPDEQLNKGIAELLIEKNRFGEIGKKHLATELQYSRFKDAGVFNYEAKQFHQSKETQVFKG